MGLTGLLPKGAPSSGQIVQIKSLVLRLRLGAAMRRRECILVIAGAAVLSPFRVRVEQQAMPAIGFLAPVPTAEAVASGLCARSLHVESVEQPWT